MSVNQQQSYIQDSLDHRIAPMDLEAYEILDTIPDVYWRYIVRHDLFLRLWRSHRHPQARHRVLDVGCGAGSLLSYLAQREPLDPTGIDLFPDTLPACRRRGIDRLSAADVTRLPFVSNHFDLVIAQDVIEHIEHDTEALAEIYRVCRPGGLALFVVPAFSFLWSTRDVQLHHYRRYTLEQMVDSVQAAGFSIAHRTYSNLFLLPLLWGAIKLAPKTPEGLAMLSAHDAPGGLGFINQALLAVARAEAILERSVGLPAGVAILVLGRKVPSHQE